MDKHNSNINGKGVEIREKRTVEVTKDWVIAIAGGIRYLGRPVEVKGWSEEETHQSETKGEKVAALPELILSPIYEIGRTANPQAGTIGNIVFPAELMTGEGLRGLLLRADVIFCLESAHERDIRGWQEKVDAAEQIRTQTIFALARLASPQPVRSVKVEDKA